MIPDELLEEILSKLPAKVLIRFRSVSKSWQALIVSQGFINKQLIYSQHINANSTTLIRVEDAHVYSADVESIDETNDSNIFEQLKRNPPLKCPDLSTETQLLGGCNGLLCLFNSKKKFVLLNPTTKRHRILPYHDGKCPSIRCCAYIKSYYGFGYDAVNDDYKFVNIVGREVLIYSLKLNSWRRAQDFPYIIWRCTNAIFANGALHWVVISRKPLIAAFDLGREEYGLVPQPEFCSEDLYITLGVLGGCLCLTCKYYYTRGIDIWVMKEYGVKESWSNIISIKHNDFPWNWNGKTVRSLAYCNCGRRVLFGDANELYLYDLGKKSIIICAAKQIPFAEYSDIGIIQPTLVRLDGGGCKRHRNVEAKPRDKKIKV